jgi:hypothetical protein
VDRSHVRVDSIERAEADDAAPAAFAHVRERGLHGPERAQQLHVQGVEHGVGGHLVGALQTGLVASPRVVHQDVHVTPARHRQVDHGFVVFLQRRVGAEVDSIGIEVGLQLLGHHRPAVLVDLGHHDGSAFLGESAGDAVPDAVAGPGDDRDLAVQTSHVSPSSMTVGPDRARRSETRSVCRAASAGGSHPLAGVDVDRLARDGQGEITRQPHDRAGDLVLGGYRSECRGGGELALDRLE